MVHDAWIVLRDGLGAEVARDWFEVFGVEDEIFVIDNDDGVTCGVVMVTRVLEIFAHPCYLQHAACCFSV